MPVTLQIVNHEASNWNRDKVSDADSLLKGACPRQYKRIQRIVQSSFTRRDFRKRHISPSANGFIWAATYAYSHHHHLVLRPEDIWFAILTQLGFFINANAEKLRAFFVDHEGQKHLEVQAQDIDFAYMAQKMTELMAKNIKDPELRDWVMPSFSTTTETDRVVGSVLFMGAMQRYFTYGFRALCGLPSVTLLGEAADWENILQRVDKIELLGEEPSLFAKMLRPIIGKMVLSFQEPQNPEVIDFWNTMISRNLRGSGSSYYTGWLTAFCYWNEDGEAKPLSPGTKIRGSEGSSLFADVMLPRSVGTDDVPCGFAAVSVDVDDNGDKYKATMIAGSAGMAATSSTSPELVQAGTTGAEPSASDQTEVQQELEGVGCDTVQPLSGWAVCEDARDERAETREIMKAQVREGISRGDVDGSIGRRLLELFRLQDLGRY